MGLDMYLYAEKYTSKYTEEELNGKLKKLFKGVESNMDTIKVKIQAGYWRKDNQIHKWFVDNVQDGEDDCKEYYVSREQLKELLELCKKVDADHSLAGEMLPTTSGFFFGGTEFDEWYFEGITSTIEILERVLKMDDSWDFSYQSSW